MGLLDILTGGSSSQATADEQAAIDAYNSLQSPTATQLSLPELQQYAAAQQMTPAQTQAFLQANNAYSTEDTSQTGTAAQVQALNQLSQVANAGANGTPQEQAQIAQALEQSNQNLAGQRGSIDQAAEARGVAPGLLQAALSQQNAGQDQQNANQSALQAQSQAYQAALNAMSSGASAGNALQGQQNTQANTVAGAQNAMQQFNAANQQSAATTNAANQQAANATNVANNNAVSQANTGLANQRTEANTQATQTAYQDALQRAAGLAGANQNAANTATGQGQQNAGLLGGLVGAAGTVLGSIYGGATGAAAGSTLAGGGTSIGNGNSTSTSQNAQLGYADGGVVDINALLDKYSGKDDVPGPEYLPDIYHGQDGREHVTLSDLACSGGVAMKSGGMIPGKPKVAGDSPKNDTVPIRVSPGEAVIPRTVVQQNPAHVASLLAGRPTPAMPQRPAQQPMSAVHDPKDLAALLIAMKQLRGQSHGA
jgi:hypothetical protein